MFEIFLFYSPKLVPEVNLQLVIDQPLQLQDRQVFVQNGILVIILHPNLWLSKLMQAAIFPPANRVCIITFFTTVRVYFVETSIFCRNYIYFSLVFSYLQMNILRILKRINQTMNPYPRVVKVKMPKVKEFHSPLLK